MSPFELYLKLGFQHIIDWGAYDHLLFILVLCIPFQLKDWKKVLVLVTAFTIGHSLTLVLTTFDVINFPRSIIEFLIPLTILITALHNFFSKHPIEEKNQRVIRLQYMFALFFGFIHGMGFAGELKLLLGKTASIFQPLLAFNIGIELGQLLFVALIFSISQIWSLLNQPFHRWVRLLSVIAAVLAVFLMYENRFW